MATALNAIVIYQIVLRNFTRDGFCRLGPYGHIVANAAKTDGAVR